MADYLSRSRAACGLGVFGVAGQRDDEIAGEMRAIGRCQRRPLLALEVGVQDQFLVVVGKDQVDAGALEVAVKEQLRVGNDDRICRRMRRTRGRRLDVAMSLLMQTGAVSGKIGVEFTSVIQ
jgi:hypothetical protein